MDDGTDISVPDEMTVAELIAKETETENRFSYIIDKSGLFAHCRWVNYTWVDGERVFAEQKGNWAAVPDDELPYLVEPYQEKKVVIKSTNTS